MSSEANFPEPAELLDNLRIHIDGLDRLILGLVRERTRLTVAIAAEKAERGLPTFQPRRHDEVIKNYLAGAADSEGLLTRADAVDLGELVMRVSRGAQDRFREGRLEAQAAERQEIAGLAAQAAAELHSNEQ